jgi:hypothetical protein
VQTKNTHIQTQKKRIQKFRKEKTKNKNSDNVHYTLLSSEIPEPDCSIFLSSEQKAQILKKKE